MRRVTDVRAAAHPGLRLVGADPHEAAHLAVVACVEIVRAVLEPLQVARRDRNLRRRRGAPEPELRPAHDRGAAGDPGQVSDRVEGDLRIVGAGLDAQVAVGAGRVELVARQRAERRERPRPPRREAEAVAPVLQEDARAQPERDREARRRQADGLASVLRRRVLRARRRPCRAPDRHLRRGVRPCPEQIAQLAGGRDREVERREHEPVGRRREDPRLVLAVERHRRRVACAAVLPARSDRIPDGPRPGQTDGAAPCRLQQAPAGQARARRSRPAYDCDTLAATVESGSASASTSGASWRRSCGVSAP